MPPHWSSPISDAPSDDAASEPAMEAPRPRGGLGEGWDGTGDDWAAGSSPSVQDAGGCGRRAGCSTATAAAAS
eukprot:14696655-Alexandrium_andersonii.AAC.1